MILTHNSYSPDAISSPCRSVWCASLLVEKPVHHAKVGLHGQVDCRAPFRDVLPSVRASSTPTWTAKAVHEFEKCVPPHLKMLQAIPRQTGKDKALPVASLTQGWTELHCPLGDDWQISQGYPQTRAPCWESKLSQPHTHIPKKPARSRQPSV